MWKETVHKICVLQTAIERNMLGIRLLDRVQNSRTLKSSAGLSPERRIQSDGTNLELGKPLR